jgi:hypothetical protein
MRKKLKGAIDDAYKGKGDSELIKPLEKLKGAMDEDFNALADAGDPILKEKLLTARATHKTLKEPFNQDEFLRKLKKGEYVNPDHLLNSAIKNDSPYATNLIMKTLPPETQDTFTTALIQKSVRKSTKDGKLDLSRLGKNLDSLGETLDAIPGPAQAKVKGIQKLISEGDYILKAAQPSSTLSKGLGSGAGAGAIGTALYTGGIGAALGVGAGLKGLSAVLTNPWAVKQIVRLGGGKLSPQTTKETISQILTKSVIPALASDGAEDMMQKEGP